MADHNTTKHKNVNGMVKIKLNECNCGYRQLKLARIYGCSYPQIFKQIGV